MTTLSIVIVSWNVRDLLRRCLDSVLRSAQSSDLLCQVIVVDSASSDGSQAMVSGVFPGVELVACETNVGFVKGNNLGVSQSNGRYILLLNPDTEVLGDALQQMVSYMETHPGLGALGPSLLDPRGAIQSSRRRFPTVATALVESTMLQPCFEKSSLLRRYYCLDRASTEGQEVDWVVGACLLIRRETWAAVGSLDENIFMYSEELDWCRRARDKGWKVMYLPSARVVHHEAQSSNQVSGSRHLYFNSSKVYYFRKHHGPLVGESIRVFLLATYVLQLGLEAAKWLVGHKRALRSERMRAYVHVLRSGLRFHSEPGRLGSGEDLSCQC
jgi:hypothetical protein